MALATVPISIIDGYFGATREHAKYATEGLF